MINPATDVVRIGPDVRGHVYAWNAQTKQWELSRNVVQIPEGWFALPKK